MRLKRRCGRWDKWGDGTLSHPINRVDPVKNFLMSFASSEVETEARAAFFRRALWGVKSTGRVDLFVAKSLQQYLLKYSPHRAIKMSGNPISFNEGPVENVPLYYSGKVLSPG